MLPGNPPPLESSADSLVLRAHVAPHCPDGCEGACIPVYACRSLGQNFVTDDSVLLDIVTAANVKPGELILEVRPCPMQACGHAGTSACPVDDAYGWTVVGSTSGSASIVAWLAS